MVGADGKVTLSIYHTGKMDSYGTSTYKAVDQPSMYIRVKTLPLMVSGGISNPTTLASHDDGFKTMIRTNGSTQNGVASNYEDIKAADGTVVGRTVTVYMADSFKKVRYISLFDWSNTPNVSELEIYIVDDGTDPEPTPPPSEQPTEEATEQPSDKPTAEPDEIRFGEPEKTSNGIKLPVRVTGSPEGIDAVIYVAEYSDSKLIAVRVVKNETISETKDIEIEYTVPENFTAKIFVWDKTQKPITGPFTI